MKSTSTPFSISSVSKSPTMNALCTPLLYRSLIGLLFLAMSVDRVQAQCETCPPSSNGNGDLWSRECYWKADCTEQGNPCTANDVRLIGSFVADVDGGPVPTCMPGDTVTVALWGQFLNNTNTNRYAVRAQTNVIIDGVCSVTLNSCAFDVLPPGDTTLSLLGTIDYVCGEPLQLQQTWVGWETSSSTCLVTDVCGEYPPSKCSKNVGLIDFLSPNFSYECGEFEQDSTEVCFMNLTTGGMGTLTYFWDFGDGNTSMLENPCHTYANDQGPSFTVTLNVIDTIIGTDTVQAGAFLVIDLDSLACCELLISCPDPNPAAVECIGDIPMPDISLIDILDSCGMVSITVDDDTTGTGCMMDTMYVTRSYYIDDGVLLDTCVQVFRAVDDEAPTMVCPDDVTVTCGESINPVDIGMPMGISDNCSTNLGATYVDTPLGTCPTTITRTWTVVDDCGNEFSCDQIIVIDDVLDPVISCPGDLTLECVEGTDYTIAIAAHLALVTASDNCDDNVDISDDWNGMAVPTLSCDLMAGLAITVTATDSCGNTDECIITISLDDTVAPELTCPGDLTLECDGSDYAAAIAAHLALVTANDACDGTVTIDDDWDGVTLPTLSCDGSMGLPITVTATDDCLNTDQCTITIYLDDTVAPVCPEAPADATYSCLDLVPPPGDLTATDGCAGDITETGVDTDNGGAGCPGDTLFITRTWTFMDDCNNACSVTQVIAVVDNVNPTFDQSCPSDVTVSCNAIPDAETLTATDNCGDAVVSFTEESTFELDPCNYAITRTWTAEDDCGNQTVCSQVITVIDDINPVCPTPPSDTMYTCPTLVPPAGTLTATDECQGPIVATGVDSDNNGAGCPGDTLIITRTWTFEDGCGNSCSVSQEIRVVDNINPTFDQSCPNDTTVSCNAIPLAPELTASDNCGDATVTFTEDSTLDTDGPCEYTITRTWTAVDDCGNQTTCVQVITVVDDLDPICPTPPGPMGFACLEEVPSPSTLTAIDACEGPIVTLGVDTDNAGSGCVNDPLIITRTWIFQDDCGNSCTVTQTIFVTDNIPPQITCPDSAFYECMDDVPPPADPSTIVATDNCGSVIVTFVGETMEGNCPKIITRTFKATDDCMNMTFCTQIITVNDTTPPMLTCPPDLTLEWPVGFNMNPVPPNTPQDPIIHPDITGYPEATDNCGILGTIYTDQLFGPFPEQCPNLWYVNRLWTTTDVCFNTFTCLQVFTFTDNTPPEITCPPDATFECGDVIPAPSITTIIATDNCGTPVVTFVGETFTEGGDCPVVGVIVRTYKATDNCMNMTTCTQTIVIEDTTPPSISCPADVTVECDQSLPMVCPTVTDNCTQNVLVDEISGTIDAGDPDMQGGFFSGGCVDYEGACNKNYETYSFTVTEGGTYTFTGVFDGGFFGDGMGGVFAGSFDPGDPCANFVAGSDDDNPNSFLDPLIIVCFIEPGDYTLVSTTFGCDDQMDYTWTIERADIILDFTDSSPVGACPSVITRTHYATDECGNVASCTQYIYIDDTTPPTLTVEDDITVECVEDIVFADPIVADNCSLVELTYTEMSGTSFRGILSGAQEVPPNGSPATGTVTGGIDTATNMFFVCVEYAGLTAGATAAHVHIAPVGVNGGVIFGLPIIVGSTSGSFDASVTLTDAHEAALLADGLYINIHTSTFPGGEIRAQLFVAECGTTVKRVWTATDECGNTATACVTATAIDVTPPAPITCPESVDLGCNPEELPLPAVITTIDNCDGVITAELLPSDIVALGCERSLLRTYRAMDNCGNAVFCTQLITWTVDTTPPSLTCPEDYNAGCNPDGVPPPGLVIVNDNCGDAFVFSFNGHYYLLSSPGTWFDTRTEALNMGGDLVAINSVEENTFLSGIFSDLGLYWIGYTDEALEGTWVWTNGDPSGFENWGFGEPNDLFGGEDYAVFNWGPPGDWNDLSGVEVLSGIIELTSPPDGGIVTVEVVNSDTTDCDASITYLYTAQDACDNTSSCTQTIMYTVDTEPPMITDCDEVVFKNCQLDNASEVLFAALIGGFASADDNCGLDSFYVASFDSIGIECGFTISLHWRAVDDCGNASTCTQLVTVTDLTAPMLTVPEDMTIQCGDEFTGVATAVDQCSEATVTYVDLQCSQTIEDFTGAYDFANWTSTFSNGGSVTTSGDSMVTLIGPDGENCPGGLSTLFSITVPEDGKLVFAWQYESQDVDPFYDPFGYNINGTFVPLTNDAGDNTQSGLAAALVSAGDVFSFEQHSTDCIIGEGETVVIDFFVFTCVEDEPADPCNYTVFRCWSATDACGNTAYDLQRIHVEDTEAPMVLCPGTATIECNTPADPQITGFATATDNCSEVIEYTYSDEFVAGDCPNEQTIIRTWYATDECDNSSSCTQIINVEDTTPPVISCLFDGEVEMLTTYTGIAPGTPVNGLYLNGVTYAFNLDASINFGPGSQQYVDGFGVEGNSSGTLILTFDKPVSRVSYGFALNDNVPADPGSVMALYDAANNLIGVFSAPAGNTGYFFVEGYVTSGPLAVRAEITFDNVFNARFLLDNLEYTCPLMVECIEDVPPVVVPGATDNCGLDLVTFVSETQAGECPTVVTRVFSATDLCGNQSLCYQVIMVQDTTPPSITCPVDASVECGDLCARGELNSVDNGGFETGAFTDGWVDDVNPPGQNACFDHGGASLDWAVLTNVPAGFFAPINPVEGSYMAVSNFDGDVRTFTLYQDLVVPAGTPSVSWYDRLQFDFDITNTATMPRVYTVELRDPVSGGLLATLYTYNSPIDGTFDSQWQQHCVDISAFSEQSVRLIFTAVVPESCTGPGCLAVDDVWVGEAGLGVTGVATATDNCSEPTVTYVDGDNIAQADPCNPSYFIRTWFATDDCGNVSSCTQRIDVIDTTPPVISCPTTATVECNESTDPQNTGFATATDLCSEVEITYSDAQVPGGCVNEYTIIRTWTASDACGNESSCTQQINVEDTTAPIISCPADVVVECGDPIPMVCPVATDNCTDNDFVTTVTGVVTEEDPLTSGWFFNTGCSEICTRNFDTYSFSIVEGGTYVFTGTFLSGGFADGMGGVFAGSFDPANPCDNFVAGDDDSGPGLDPLVISCLLGPGEYVLVSTTFACSPQPDHSYTWNVERSNLELTHVDSDTMGSCPGIIIRTHYATDACGNVSSCTQRITIDDTTPPTLTVEDDMLVECVEDIVFADAIAEDGCSDVTVSYSEMSGTTFSGILQGAQEVPPSGSPAIGTVQGGIDTATNMFFVCVEYNGLLAGATAAHVHIAPFGVNGPVILPLPIIPGSTSGSFDVSVTLTDAHEASLLANGLYINIHTSLFPGGEIRAQLIVAECGTTVKRIWTASDECGNTATACVTKTALDMTPPAPITCPESVDLGCNPEELPLPAVITTIDNCDGVITAELLPSDIVAVGCERSLLRTYRAMDNCGNAVFCTQLITWTVDTIAPSLVCPNGYNAGCNPDGVPGPGYLNIIDNCGDEYAFSFNGHYYLLSSAGTWLEARNEALNLGGDLVAINSAEENAFLIGVFLFSPYWIGYTDEAVEGTWVWTNGDPSVFESWSPDEPNDAGGEDYAVFSWFSGAGNWNDLSGVEEFQGIIELTSPPDGALVTVEIANSDTTDCDASITYLYTAQDDCGNTSSCTQTIMYTVDTVPPMITNCDDITFRNCEFEPEEVVFLANEGFFAQASDDCGLDTFFVDGVVFGEIDCGFTVTLAWRALDDCGNTSTCTQVITVTDLTAPILTVPADMTIQCGDEFTGVATAVDACSATFVTYVDLQCTQTIEDFTGPYDFSNWTVSVTNGGTVTTSGDTMATLVSPDGDNCLFNGGASSLLSITIPEDGKLIFAWNYTTDDVAPGFDPFGYNINGTFVQLTDNGGPDNQSGLAAALVSAGDVFAFEQSSTDCIIGAGATTVIDFFVYTCAEEDPADPCNYDVFRCWSATDACGNTAYDLQRIHVEDTIAPFIICPETETRECNTPVDPEFTGTPIVTDNCGEFTFTYVDAITEGDCAAEYTITRTWYAEDDCGNVASCTQTIEVVDNTPPSIFCPGSAMLALRPAIRFDSPPDPDIATYSVDLVDCSLTVGGFGPNFDFALPTRFGFDVQPNTGQVYMLASPDLPGFNVNRHLYLLDVTSGVTIDLGQLISSNGSDMPQDITFDGAGILYAVFPGELHTVDLNTLATTFVANVSSGGVGITYDFDNNRLLVASGSGTVTIDEVTLPGFAVNTLFSYVLGGFCTSQALEYIGDGKAIASSTFGCDIITTLDLDAETAMTSSPTGTFLDIKDFMWLGGTLGYVECTGDEVSPDPSETGIPLVFDNCSEWTVTYTDETIPTDDPCAPFAIIRTWVAEDECGNVSTTCNQLIEIRDTTPPSITCPDDVTVECSIASLGGLLGSSSQGTNAGSLFSVDPSTALATLIGPHGVVGGSSTRMTDVDVDPTTGILYGVLGGSAGLGATLITLDPVTGAGTLVASVNLFGADGLAFAADGTLYIGNWTGANGSIVTVDKTNGNIIAQFTIGDGSFGTHAAGLHVAPNGTLWASRGGNVYGSIYSLDPTTGAILTTLPLVNAAGGPELVAVSDIAFSGGTLYASIPSENNLATIDLNTGVLTRIGNFGMDVTNMSGLGIGGLIATAIDNCDEDVAITYSDEQIGEGCDYVVLRTWYAHDDCGNVATCIQTINVIDDTAPEIVCPANTELECDESTDPQVTGLPTATDNCASIITITYSDELVAGDCGFTIIRTWFATDECDNTAECTQVLTVVDTTPPSITCPADASIECGFEDCPGDGPNAVDNAGFETGDFTAWTDDVNPPGQNPCFDHSGASLDWAVLTVVPPGFFAQIDPVEGSYMAVSNFDGDVRTFTLYQDVAVPAGNPSISWYERIQFDFDQGNIATLPRVYTVELVDPNNGNVLASLYEYTSPLVDDVDSGWQLHCVNISEYAGQTVRLLFTADVPELCTGPGCLAIDAIHVSEAVEGFPVVGEATATDNCSEEVDITYVDADVVTQEDPCNPSYVIRTWYATDDCGNVASCTQRIDVIDTTGPEISCPATATIECDEDPDPLVTGIATATDICSETVTITYSDEQVEGECANAYTIVRTWVATDACGNESSCTQTINVEDNTPPSLAVPADTAVDCHLTFTVLGIENLSGLLTVNSPMDIAGEYLVGLATFGPVLTSTPITADLQLVDDNVMVVTDACESPLEDLTGKIALIDRGTCFFDDKAMRAQEAGAIAVIIANSFSGNNDHALGMAGDTNALVIPVVSVSYNTGVLLKAALLGGPVNITLQDEDIIVSDNCDPAPLVFYDANPIFGDCPAEYTMVRTWTAVDDCGNSTVATQHVMVIDTIAPQITCPDDIIAECGEIPDPVDVFATDLCALDPILATWVGDEIVQEGCVYNVVRTYRATDLCGNSSTCTQHIMVGDDEPPVIGLSGGDNCAGTYMIIISGDSFLDETTWELRNANNEVVASGGPYAQNTNNIAYYTASGFEPNAGPFTFFISSDGPVFDDNDPDFAVVCGESVLVEGSLNGGQTFTSEPFCCEANFMPPQNCSGNYAVILQGDGFLDETTWEIRNPANTVVASGGPYDPETLNVDVYSADGIAPNAGPFTLHISTVGDFGDNVAFYLVSCGQVLISGEVAANTTFDSEPFCCELETGCPEGGDLGCNPDELPPPAEVTAVDNCDDDVDFQIITTTDTIGCQGILVYEYRATDDCGNTTACTQRYTYGVGGDLVMTCTKPAPFFCPEELPDPMFISQWLIDEGYASAEGTCEQALVEFVDFYELDNNCALAWTFGYTAQDGCGGQADTCYIIVQIYHDDETPAITCSDPPHLGCNPEAIPSAQDLINAGYVSASDNCGPVALGFIAPYLQTEENCEITRQYRFRATDACGNQSTVCTVTVRWRDDDEAPVLTCPADLVIDCPDTIPAVELATATDNCGVELVTFVGEVGSGTFCDSLIVRTYYAVDSCGNEAYCTQQIIFRDITPPSITCPADVTLECGVDTIPTTLATASDACDADVDVTYVDAEFPQECDVEVFVDGEFKVVTLIVRTHYATDDCGNVASCTQHIIIRDDTPPMLTCPDDITIQCDQDPNDLELTGVGTAVDLCDPEAFATILISFTSFESPCSTVITRVWEASDQCGNGGSSEVCVQLISIVDTEAPMITCPDDLTLECGDDLPETFASATDNCNEFTLTYSDHICSQYGFTGDFDFANWTAIEPDFGGDVTTVGDQQVILTGPDGGCPGGNNTVFSIVVPEGGTLVFQWSYHTNDGDGASWDPFGFTVNGSFSQLSDNAGPADQSGVASVQVEAGDEFAFVQNSLDCIAGEAATTVIDFFGCIGEGDDTLGDTCNQVVIRTHYAEDACGNVASCVQLIYFEDTTPPSISCPPAVTLECGDEVPTDLATATDICDDELDITYSDVISGEGDCVNFIFRTHVATDDCGNASSCQQVIVIVDTTPPSITCPDDLTLECGDTLGGPELATAIDICTEVVFVTIVSEEVSGDACEMTIVRTYQAQDDCGNTATCTQTITIMDTTAPEISCPADITLDCDQTTCLTFDDFVVGQNGPLVVVDQIVQGTLTIDITAWSKGGIQQDPVLYNTSTPHPNDLDLGTPNTLYGGPGINGDDPDGYEATNNRSVGNIVVVQTPGLLYPNDYLLSDSIVFEFSEPVFIESAIVVDFELEQILSGGGIFLYDADGNQISFTAALGDGNDNSMNEVVLQEPGVSKMKLYYGTVIPASGGISSICYTYVPCETGGVTTFDACSAVDVICQDTTVSINECITHVVRTYSAVDACDNANNAACTQTITLITDGQQPDVMCPADITIGCEDEVPAPDPGLVTATDNCSAPEDIMITWVEDISEGLGCAEVIRRIYLATDECGNEALCVQFITREGIPQQIVFVGEVFLQAAMTVDTVMDARLNDMNYLPADQPYGMAPYNYNGTEHCDNLHEDIVDWVLVQLRDAVTMEVVDQKAGLVKENGMIVATDCESPIVFNAVGDWYYVTICHRNHLGIVTDVPMDCSEGWTICDFTEEHGTMEGMVEYMDGVYAMTRGDVNGDNLIKYNGSNNDKNAILMEVGITTPNNVLEGYNRFDVNMDGLVKYNGSNNDKNAILSEVGLLTPNNVITGPLYE